MSSLISVKNVSFAYDGHTVIEGLDFSLNVGEVISVVGPNGSGKSTLVRGLLGEKKPSSGEIVYSRELPKNALAYLPQRSDAGGDFPATVYEAVLSGTVRPFVPFYGAAAKKRADDAIGRMNISSLAKQRFSDLSGGQKQRVLLARALCRDARILLLDEPSTGLDRAIGEELYRLIAELNRTDGIAVIIVTHELSPIHVLGGKVLHLDHTQRYFGDAEGYFGTDHGMSLFGGENSDRKALS